MKLCLAGLNCIREDTYSVLKDVPFVLESYCYIRDYQLPLIKSAELFILDSGAFTFMSNAKKAVVWEEYLQKYINFIKEYDVDHFIELDIDSIVGYEEVKRFRTILERETGKKCIPAWHKSRGLKEYRNLCENYDYIAIGGIKDEIRPGNYKYFKQLTGIAKEYGTKVHGLGLSCQKVEDYGFYSCDSTSWNAISRFGTIYKFDGEKIVSVKGSKNKNLKVKQSLYKQGELHNIKEWIKYQKYLDKK